MSATLQLSPDGGKPWRCEILDIATDQRGSSRTVTQSAGESCSPGTDDTPRYNGDARPQWPRPARTRVVHLPPAEDFPASRQKLRNGSGAEISLDAVCRYATLASADILRGPAFRSRSASVRCRRYCWKVVALPLLSFHTWQTWASMLLPVAL